MHIGNGMTTSCKQIPPNRESTGKFTWMRICIEMCGTFIISMMHRLLILFLWHFETAEPLTYVRRTNSARMLWTVMQAMYALHVNVSEDLGEHVLLYSLLAKHWIMPCLKRVLRDYCRGMMCTLPACIALYNTSSSAAALRFVLYNKWIDERSDFGLECNCFCLTDRMR